jgi:hypothetical protein
VADPRAAHQRGIDGDGSGGGSWWLGYGSDKTIAMSNPCCYMNVPADVCKRLDWQDELKIIQDYGFDLPLWAIDRFMKGKVQSWSIDGELDLLTISVFGYEDFDIRPNPRKRPFKQYAQ